jgi:hypothetical protein
MSAAIAEREEGRYLTASFFWAPVCLEETGDGPTSATIHKTRTGHVACIPATNPPGDSAPTGLSRSDSLWGAVSIMRPSFVYGLL